MSILSTAVLAASLLGAAGTGNLQDTDVITQNISRSQISLNAIQKEDLELIRSNPGLQKLMRQCGISEQTLNSLLSGQSIIIRPDCGPSRPGTDAPGNGGSGSGGSDKPDNGGSGSGGSDKPDNGGSGSGGSDKPDNGGSGSGGSDKPDNGGNDSVTDNSYAAQVISLVNQERARYHLAPLTTEQNISDAALTRAKEIVTSFSHTRPDGTSFSTALKEHGVSYRGSGENIAWGQKTPEEVVRGWMNSSGHRANILNEKFTSIGVGYHVENGRAYWTQLFTY